MLMVQGKQAMPWVLSAFSLQSVFVDAQAAAIWVPIIIIPYPVHCITKLWMLEKACASLQTFYPEQETNKHLPREIPTGLVCIKTNQNLETMPLQFLALERAKQRRRKQSVLFSAVTLSYLESVHLRPNALVYQTD